MPVIALVFVLGASIGSFTNVLILRLPASESVVRPRSRCPVCGRPLAWYENLPILSWIALRGRCRTCRTPISIQYPLVELTVALLFTGNFVLYGPGGGAAPGEWLDALLGPEWIVASIFMTLLLAIALTDVRTYLIPDELSIGGMLLGLLLSLLPGGVTPVSSLIGTVAGGALLLVVAWLGGIVFRKEAMGGGDIKMLGMIGAFTGWRGVFLTLFLGALLGSILYAPIALLHRSRRAAAASVASALPPDALGEASGSPEEVDRGLVPFGFFLAPAAAITYYLGDELVRAYLGLVGLSG